MLCSTLSSVALPPGQEFMVNLPSELMEIVVETRYLEQLGFPIPERARNMALQEEKLLSYQDGLKHILQRYRGCIEALQPAEVRQSTAPLHLPTPTHALALAYTQTQNTHVYIRTYSSIRLVVCMHPLPYHIIPYHLLLHSLPSIRASLAPHKCLPCPPQVPPLPPASVSLVLHTCLPCPVL